MSRIKRAQLAAGLDVYYRSEAELEILRREYVHQGPLADKRFDVKAGDCIFDVGANIGFFLINLNRFAAAAQVFCFEPVPETFELLELNAKANNKLDVRLFNCGLSDRAGTATFVHQPLMSVASTMCPDDSPEARRNGRRFVYEEMRNRSVFFRTLSTVTPRLLWWPLTEIIRRAYDRPVEVTCSLRTLSEVIDEFDVRQIDLLKIDVEGAEEAVIAGLREEHWPRIRQALIETHRGRAQADAVADSLRRRGFVVEIERLMQEADHLHLLFAKR